MTESSGEIKAMGQYGDRVNLEIQLIPEDSDDPMQIWEWRIGEKVRVIGHETKDA